MPDLKRELSDSSINTTVVPIFKVVVENRPNNLLKAEMPTLIKEELSMSHCVNNGKISPSTATAKATVPCHYVDQTLSKEQLFSHNESWAADSLGLPAVPDCTHLPNIGSTSNISSDRPTRSCVLNLNSQNTLYGGSMNRNLFDDNFTTHYDSELVEQQGWKVPKLTIRKRCRPKSTPDMIDQNSTGCDSMSSDNSSIYLLCNPKRKRKKKKHKTWHKDSRDAQCFYNSDDRPQSIRDVGELHDLERQPIKRLRLKFGGSSIIDIIPHHA